MNIGRRMGSREKAGELRKGSNETKPTNGKVYSNYGCYSDIKLGSIHGQRKWQSELSMAPLTHSFAQLCSLHSRALLRLFVHSLAHSLAHSQACGKVNDLMSQTDLVLSHSSSSKKLSERRHEIKARMQMPCWLTRCHEITFNQLSFYVLSCSFYSSECRFH